MARTIKSMRRLSDQVVPKFNDAVRWSEYGMACFISAAISIPIIQGFDGSFSFWSMIITTLFTGIPLLLTLLTYEKLVKPLKKHEAPSRKWSIFLTLMGIFGLGIGVYIFAHTDEKIKKLLGEVDRSIHSY